MRARAAHVDRVVRSDPAPLRTAAREPGRALATEVRRPLESLTRHDFGSVRVHDGPVSREVADAHDANAVTVGPDVFLGSAAARMPVGENRRLLAHESIHALQQGGRRVEHARDLPVSRADDAAERDADAMRPGRQLHAAALQRDLKGKHKVAGGEFTMDLKTVAKPADDSGMDGTITFMPSAAAPDSKNIRLYQSTRVTDDEKGGVPVPGRGGSKDQMTKADPAHGVQGGWRIDIAPGAKPRTAKSDPDVSPYYKDHSPFKSINRDGWKIGPNVKEAKIYDHPYWNRKSSFDFETVAQDADKGHVYGTVMWGFRIQDGWLGVVGNEYAVGRNVTLMNTDKAMEKFKEHFRNKGTKNAP